MNKLAPILLFTYKRLDILKEIIHSLQQNYLAVDSELLIFSDAARTEYDVFTIKAVREYLKTVDGFKRVTIYEAKVNKGLAKSIIDGVSHAMKLHDKVIVLEDDLRTTPNFLNYMNTCLNKYESNNNVFSISGYSFNLGTDYKSVADVYFLNRGWSWGWATWRDRWNKVDWLVNDYTTFILDKHAQKSFAKGGSDLNGMLKKQMNGQLDSWAIRWFYWQFKVSGLTLYPLYSKVHNIGFDNNATHTTGSSNRYEPIIDLENKQFFSFPETIEISPFYQKHFQRKMGIRARICSRIESLFKQAFSITIF